MNDKARQNPSIVIDKLSKKYAGSSTFALDSLSLHVYPGEVYGFLGPNGAGKSTTIRLLMNFIQPSSGDAQILGQDVVRDSVTIKQSIGYLSGDSAMCPKMTGQEFLEYMHKLQPAKSAAYIKELAKRLKADLRKPIGDLSRGNRQKIGIIQAFMHQPQVLILDEPSSGLDPLMQEVFYDLLRESKARGASIFMSSHVLSEVQKVCDRIGIIREGKLMSERTLSELIDDSAHTFDITFKNSPPEAAIKKLKGVSGVAVRDNTLSLNMKGDLSPFFQLLAAHEVLKINTRSLDLEDVFLQFYEDKDKRA